MRPMLHHLDRGGSKLPLVLDQGVAGIVEVAGGGVLLAALTGCRACSINVASRPENGC